MENNFWFIVLAQIILTHASIPNWDVDNLSVGLFSSSSSGSTYPYDLYNANGYVLTKIITKNSYGTLSSSNQLTYNSQTKTVGFEGIESVYTNQLGCNQLVCPKGSFHPYCFSNGSYVKSDSFQGSSWELSCYYHNTDISLFSTLIMENIPYIM